MKQGEKSPDRSGNERTTHEITLGGRNRLDFGTVRPRVQIPGPRPTFEFRFMIPDAYRGFALFPAIAVAVASTSLGQLISAQFPRWLGWLGLVAGVVGIATSAYAVATAQNLV